MSLAGHPLRNRAASGRDIFLDPVPQSGRIPLGLYTRERCYFVSEENRETLQSNLGIELSRCEIVDNPFTIRRRCRSGLAVAPREFWKLACVARIHFPSKSQDLLVRVLRLPKWRARPLEGHTVGHTTKDFCRNCSQMIDLMVSRSGLPMVVLPTTLNRCGRNIMACYCRRAWKEMRCRSSRR